MKSLWSLKKPSFKSETYVQCALSLDEVYKHQEILFKTLLVHWNLWNAVQ